MTVINKSTRESMVETLVLRAFESKEKQAQSEFNKCFDELYIAYHGAENIKLMASLPEQYFTYRSSVRFTFSSYVAYSDKSLPCSFKFATNGSWTEKELMSVVDQRVIDLIKKRSNALESIKSEKSAFKDEMNAVICSARTFKKLWQIWPECHEILGEFEPTSEKIMLPALQTDRLNKILDIPTEQ